MIQDCFFFEPAFLSNQGPYETLVIRVNGVRYSAAWYTDAKSVKMPLKAPFACIQWDNIPTADGLHALFSELEVYWRSKSMATVSLVLPPDIYLEDYGNIIQKVLEQKQFRLSWQDINFHLKTHTSFRHLIHRSERWRLNKALRQGYAFSQIQAPDWDFFYEFIAESRRRKGFFLSMTKEELRRSSELFPNQYHFFGVSKDKEWVALAVTVQVSPKILYVLYTADKLEHRKVSPVVLLHAGVFEFAQSKGFQVLDMGTASLKGMVNNGVAIFKRGLGGVLSLKNTYSKTFNF